MPLWTQATDMSEDRPTEACGRCSMTTVVDAAKSHGDGGRPDPFSDDCIEVSKSSMRRVSPAAWTKRITARLNAVVERLTYGR